MHLFWDIATRSVLEAVRPRVVLEVGAARGNNTKLIAAHCAETGAVCHTIDPAPRFDVAELLSRFGDAFCFHQGLSLDVLPSIPQADVLLLDGDHNWYTVYHELRLIESSIRNYEGRFPVLLLHDMEWPYARRDLYYDPAAIPEEYRHPYAKMGMVRGKVQLSETGGLNTNLDNALHEGGPRNGVRTAVEDFIRESNLELVLTVLPVHFGLGVLTTREQLDNSPELRAVVDHFETREGLTELLNFSETTLTTTLAQVQWLRAAVDAMTVEAGPKLKTESSEKTKAVEHVASWPRAM